MSDGAIHDDRVFDLAGAICDDCASENDVVELDSLVLADEESGRRYWDYCQMHVVLGMEASVQRALQKGCRCPRESLDLATLLPWEADALLATTVPAASTSASPPFGVFRTGLDGTLGLFSSGWPAAYLTATLILGLGLFIGGLIRVSPSDYRFEQAAGPSADLRSPIHDSLPKAAVVGRITGLAACRWERTSEDGNQQPEIKNWRSLIRLGDTLTVSSGLMEITYDTGARVILQGPVTYEVESVSGGYLAVGKLTARLEQRSEVRSQRSANQKSEIRNQNSFAVRTPTAIVTDLGTEFGVEVRPDRRENVLVFQGRVQVALSQGKNAMQGKNVLLSQGQSVRIEPGKDLRPSVGADSAGSRAFVRQLPVPTAKLPVVRNPSFEDRRFEDDTPPKFWRYWVVTGDGKSPQAPSSLGGLAATADGKSVFQIVCGDNSAVETWQALDAPFIPGQTYRLTVAVGMRNDLDRKDNHAINAAEADWKIGLYYADTGKRVAVLNGTIPNDRAHTGFLRDETLTYTAMPADAGHRIEIRLGGSTVGKQPTQPGGVTMICMSFDNVRLNVPTTAKAVPGQSDKAVSEQPSERLRSDAGDRPKGP